MKFPREVWAGSHLEGASQPKRIVVEEDKFKTFVSSHNGKMNVYTSVYDFKEYVNNRGLEHTAILDRIFLDIDAHDGHLKCVLNYING